MAAQETWRAVGVGDDVAKGALALTLDDLRYTWEWMMDPDQVGRLVASTTGPHRAIVEVTS